MNKTQYMIIFELIKIIFYMKIEGKNLIEDLISTETIKMRKQTIKNYTGKKPILA